MKNYTTKIAALKATTIDARILDTKVLKINGELFDPSADKNNYKIIKTTFKKKDVWVGNWGDGRLALQFEPYSPVIG